MKPTADRQAIHYYGAPHRPRHPPARKRRLCSNYLYDPAASRESPQLEHQTGTADSFETPASVLLHLRPALYDQHRQPARHQLTTVVSRELLTLSRALRLHARRPEGCSDRRWLKSAFLPHRERRPAPEVNAGWIIPRHHQKKARSSVARRTMCCTTCGCDADPRAVAWLPSSLRLSETAASPLLPAPVLSGTNPITSASHAATEWSAFASVAQTIVQNTADAAFRHADRIGDQRQTLLSLSSSLEQLRQLHRLRVEVSGIHRRHHGRSCSGIRSSSRTVRPPAVFASHPSYIPVAGPRAADLSRRITRHAVPRSPIRIPKRRHAIGSSRHPPSLSSSQK